MKTPFLLSLAFVFTCLPAIGISLRILPWDDETAERKLSIAYGTTIVETGYLHPSARSQEIKLPEETANLRLEANDRKAEDGKPESVRINLPAGIKKPLLLILPDKKAKTGVRTLVIEDDQSAFRWGTIRLINVTPQPLVFRWEKKAKAVPAGWKPVNISPEGKSRNLEVFLYLKDDLKKHLYSAVWEHRTDMRQLVFMVPSTDTSLGPVEFKFVPEIRIEEESP